MYLMLRYLSEIFQSSFSLWPWQLQKSSCVYLLIEKLTILRLLLLTWIRFQSLGFVSSQLPRQVHEYTVWLLDCVCKLCDFSLSNVSNAPSEKKDILRSMKANHWLQCFCPWNQWSHVNSICTGLFFGVWEPLIRIKTRFPALLHRSTLEGTNCR